MKVYRYGYDRASALLSALDAVNKRMRKDAAVKRRAHDIKIMRHRIYRYMWT